jgi:hypothetical protein
MPGLVFQGVLIGGYDVSFRIRSMSSLESIGWGMLDWVPADRLHPLYLELVDAHESLQSFVFSG